MHMSTLVKFCKPEHNILDRCYTVRLGTFEYYREMDPSFAIADAAEGRESTNINSMDSAAASPEAVAAVAAIAPLPHIQIKDIRFNVTFPNCYIWCCSRLAEPITAAYGARFDNAYTSCYRIKDAARFGEHLSALLMTNITRTAFADPARAILDGLSIAEMGEITLSVFHRDVLYVDEKLSAIDEGQHSAYVRGIPPVLRPIFVKPTKYADDREYRFVFLFEHRRHGSLAVRREPVDLPVIPIQSI
jgi:hypothetical protein